MYTRYTSNTPLNTLYTPYIRPKYALNDRGFNGPTVTVPRTDRRLVVVLCLHRPGWHGGVLLWFLLHGHLVGRRCEISDIVLNGIPLELGPHIIFNLATHMHTEI